MQQKGIKLNTILTKPIIIPSGQLKSGMYEITSANMSRILKKPMQQISIIATKQKHIPIDSLFSFLWVLGYIIQVKNSDDVIFYMGEKWDIHCFIINCYHLYKHVININDSRKNQQILLIILPIILNYPKNYTLQMQTSAQSRKNRMASIRASLQQNPVMKKNTQTLQSKIAKKSKRKESLKLDNIQNTIEIDLNAMVDKQDKPGSVGKFHQKYQLGDKIGQGSNGLVRKCYLRSTNQIYAVKEINMDEQHIMFLKANFKYIKQLNHPNIIRYHVMYLDNRKKTCYLVMDYDTNPCLLKFHDLCQLEIKGIIFQLINTLVYVHSQNICHRDIKPENILYDRGNKKIKIIDFGISKKIVERGAKREMLTITGTLYYRAPEMFLGGGYDEKVDLWASGVTLYQLLSQGRTPFQSDYLSTTIENITRGEVQYPEEIWNKYDKFAKDLVSRLLKKSSQRLTALQARRHFWFEDQNYEGIDITKSDTFFKSVSPTKNPKKTFKQDGSFKFQRSLTNTFKIQPDEKPSSDRKQSMLKKWLAGSDDDDVLVDIESEEQENIMQRQPSYAQQ